MSIDRTDGTGLGIAIAGHALLFAALTFSIAHRQPPKHFEAAPIDVQLVDAVGLQSATPTPATEAPQQQTAPEVAPPEAAQAAPPPTPAPPAPKEQVKPAPSQLPSPKPVKAEPAKPTPAKPDLRLSSSLLKDLRATAKAEGAGKRATGSLLGNDFLKGVVSASAGKGASARAPISGAAMNGLAAAIKKQVQPCYEIGSLGGTDAMQIVTVLHLRFNKDGSVNGLPQVAEQTGLTDSNRRYSKQMAEMSRNAVLRCAPLKLPAELYEGGWENIEMGFIPGQMR